MKKVLYICSTLPIGGAQEHILSVVSRIAPYGYTPIVCCMGDNGEIGREMSARGIEVRELNRMKRKTFDPGLIKDMVSIIKTAGIDLVHTHLYHANTYGRVAAIMARVPMVATEHSLKMSHSTKRNFINRLLAKKTARIIAVSEAVKKETLRWDSMPPDKIQVIYNGIDDAIYCPPSKQEKLKARSLLGLKPDDLVAGMVSRLTEVKGHRYLIEAMVSVKAKLPQAKLLLVGSGPLETILKEQARSLGLEKDVIFHGPSREVPDILKALDLFVMSSLWEGLAIALIEAMATALPVVVTNVGGMPEVVEDGVSGCTVDIKDSSALSSAILSILGEKKKAEAFGKRGYEIVQEKFLAETMVESIVSLYDDVLGVTCSRS